MNHRTSYKIPKNKQKELILECIHLSYKTSVDELDCSKSFCRVPTEKTMKEILDIGFGDKKTLYNFIYRAPICWDEEYFCVGFCTIGLRPDYFLWLRLTIEDGKRMIEKYKLKNYEFQRMV